MTSTREVRGAAARRPLGQLLGQPVVGHVDLDVHLLDAGDGGDLLQRGAGLAETGPGLDADHGRHEVHVELAVVGDVDCLPRRGSAHGGGHLLPQPGGWPRRPVALLRVVRLGVGFLGRPLQRPGDHALQPVAGDLAGGAVLLARFGQSLASASMST